MIRDRTPFMKRFAIALLFFALPARALVLDVGQCVDRDVFTTDVPAGTYQQLYYGGGLAWDAKAGTAFQVAGLDCYYGFFAQPALSCEICGVTEGEAWIYVGRSVPAAPFAVWYEKVTVVQPATYLYGPIVVK